MRKMYIYMLLPYIYFAILLVFGLIIIKLIKKKKKNIYKVEKTYFYRDIPCYKNINLVFWLLYNFGGSNNDNLYNGLIGAYLLMWYQKGNIKIKKISNFNDNDYQIYFNNEFKGQNNFENELYRFLKLASNNNVLEKNELKRYCNINDDNRIKLKYLFKICLNDVQKELEKNKLITTKYTIFDILLRNEAKIILSDKLLIEYQNLIGLKNFLLDFSSINEKKLIEIHLWDDYLIFANLLGISDEVKKQFSSLYPNTDSFDFDLLGDSSVLSSAYKGMKLNLTSILISIIFIFFILLSGDIFGAQLTKILIVTVGFAIIFLVLFKILKGK